MNFKREICNGEPLDEFIGINQLYQEGKLWDIKVVGQNVYMSRMSTPSREEEKCLGADEALKLLEDQEVEKITYDNTPKSNFMKSIESQESRRPLKTILGRYRKS